VGQFIDIGSGLPTVENTHEIVQREDRLAPVVYVDNDPVVISHAKALLKGEPQVFFLSGDLREPKGILGNPGLQSFINFDRPVAIVLVAVLHFLPRPEAYEAVDIIKQAVAPGSCLIISHAAGDSADPDTIKTVKDTYDRTSSPIVMRTLGEVTQFFDGFNLAGPVSDINDWWNPEGEKRSTVACYGGVAIKPRA
jgi:SAM-dependent methyltransferase